MFKDYPLVYFIVYDDNESGGGDDFEDITAENGVILYIYKTAFIYAFLL